MSKESSSTPPEGRPYLSFSSDFAPACAEVFFKELFRLVPGSPELFSDPQQQKVMFATMLDLMMQNADNSETLKTTLQDLGRRHRELGVQSMHLKIGKAAFMRGIAAAAPDLTDQEEEFFSNAYDKILAAMSPLA